MPANELTSGKNTSIAQLAQHDSEKTTSLLPQIQPDPTQKSLPLLYTSNNSNTEMETQLSPLVRCCLLKSPEDQAVVQIHQDRSETKL
ncbi:hypothetical protein M419DRAFT_120300 [Trichoderma reesei RUT C-30]|uniref:Uncharacterized protein n=1 Tax=Hypocrea jecorina (strain ATCC 56765 / BCRC 32924 / NRRL 11460 / Rut C-30) TaxID=1344414 RepID=A0A024S0P8_HYPJR|nr:hypothetical protein M419DRAFT_120300 [Trichoderma reesei RUT C-30]